MRLWRKFGISLLVPTQNAGRTVELCIRSFVDFADEIIVVDNGSTDNTIEIVSQLECEIAKLTFYNVPELPDLYQNRQYALERASFNWIARLDSDYVAYTDGPRDIKNLRELILATKRTFPPIAYGITQVELFQDYWHIRLINDASPIQTLPARIIQHFPGMRFKRLGRWEGVNYQNYLKHIPLKEPYWFHCQFKASDRDLLFRSERTNWRQLGRYDKYPTLESYVRSVIGEKYQTSDLEEAGKICVQRESEPRIVKYDAEKCYPYPVVKYDAEKCYPYPEIIQLAMGRLLHGKSSRASGSSQKGVIRSDGGSQFA